MLDLFCNRKRDIRFSNSEYVNIFHAMILIPKHLKIVFFYNNIETLKDDKHKKCT